MKFLHRALPFLIAAAVPFAAMADLPGKHPRYLHALSDLRAARAHIEHRPGDAAVSGQEDVAISRIDEAIAEIKRAAIDDGKNLNDHPPVDAKIDHKGKLHRAEELLRKVKADVHEKEDDPMTKGLKPKIERHVEEALQATHRALEDAEHHK
jgi:hypothetical protein